MQIGTDEHVGSGSWESTGFVASHEGEERRRRKSAENGARATLLPGSLFTSPTAT